MKSLLIRKPRTGAEASDCQDDSRSQGAGSEQVKEYVLSRVKDKAIDCTYPFRGGGGCSIANADSTDQLNEQLSASPMALFYKYEIRALSD